MLNKIFRITNTGRLHYFFVIVSNCDQSPGRPFAQDVDFGEAEDFDDLPAEDAPNEETLVADDAPADNGSAAADGNNQAAPANGQSEAASTVAADATEVDGADGQAETGPTAASVPVANAAAVDAGGNAGTASKM